MAVTKTTIEVNGINGTQKKLIYKENTWDGDLGEWMAIGGEAAGVLDDYEKVEVVLTPKKGGIKLPKLKKVCFNCKTFDRRMSPAGYKCAVKRSCPGLSWPKDKIRKAIELNDRKKLRSKSK